MVSTRDSLAALLSDQRKYTMVQLLYDKGQLPFSLLRETCKFRHNQSLSRSLHRLEVLGLIDHTYKRGSVQVYSYYQLTGFGRKMVEMLDSIK